MHIDHTTLRTALIDETKDFMVRVFDLVEGPRPAVIAANIPGYWLYHKDAPLVHIIQSPIVSSQPAGYSPEAIDHTAFFMEGFEAFRQKLSSLSIRHSVMELEDIGEKRIFLQTPTGILLEAVFRER